MGSPLFWDDEQRRMVVREMLTNYHSTLLIIQKRKQVSIHLVNLGRGITKECAILRMRESADLSFQPMYIC